MELVDLFLCDNLDFLGVLKRDALVSPCGKYRYWLIRRWGPGDKVLLYLMLNPSTADASQDDQTVRRCVYFARRAGYDAATILNLYAYRATSPRTLRTFIEKGGDAVGPDNLYWIMECSHGVPKVVLAWGNMSFKDQDRHHEVMRATFRVLPRDVRYLCLGATANESPRHPSRLGNQVEFEEYLPDVALLPEDSEVRQYILGR
jgi:hypothetical protein